MRIPAMLSRRTVRDLRQEAAIVILETDLTESMADSQVFGRDELWYP
jgi:hypothetical protein